MLNGRVLTPEELATQGGAAVEQDAQKVARPLRDALLSAFPAAAGRLFALEVELEQRAPAPLEPSVEVSAALRELLEVLAQPQRAGEAWRSRGQLRDGEA